MSGLLLRTACLLVAGAAAGAAFNAVRPAGVGVSGFVAASTCGAEPTADGRVVLPPREALTLCGDPGVLVADVRSAARFAEGHVANAIHLPCRASGDALGGAMSRLSGKHTVIVYGDSTVEARPVAESLAQRLGTDDGALVAAPRIVVLDGGFGAWDQAGLACSSGPCPECQRHLGSEP